MSTVDTAHWVDSLTEEQVYGIKEVFSLFVIKSFCFSPCGGAAQEGLYAVEYTQLISYWDKDNDGQYSPWKFVRARSIWKPPNIRILAAQQTEP
jgi:hypothetical protein